jgi:hypothetical protein
MSSIVRRICLTQVLLLFACAERQQPGVGAGGRVDAGVDLAATGDLVPPPVCLAGRYLGTFEGQILVAGIAPLTTKGTVDLTLTQSEAGEFLLEIRNGHLVGKADDKDYSADLLGTLDCHTLKLESGALKNGTVRVSGLDYGFEGPMTADYDAGNHALVNGTWNITQTTGPMILKPSTGHGTWTATHM